MKIRLTSRRLYVVSAGDAVALLEPPRVDNNSAVLVVAQTEAEALELATEFDRGDRELVQIDYFGTEIDCLIR